MAEVPNVYFLGPAQIDHWYPTQQKFSGQGDSLGAIPYTEDYFIALGSSIVRAAHSILKAPHKVLALDCDNTLWKGICGEDGPEGVSLTAGHRALQKFALAQRNAGMLLAISSKNNEADVIETFTKHPEFPLRLSDITATRINWNPKPLGLASIASELSLALDSFIFLDDNPKEISEIDEQIPQILGLTLPPDPASFETYLNHIWAFDRLKITQADASRADSYQGIQEFGKALHDAGSLESFYQTLELQVVVRPVTPTEIPRASQLTQRTNQFNFTTIRHTEAAIQSLIDMGADVIGVHVRDRFGDYGFTGLLIGRVDGDKYALENMLLSCRVLGRGVEHRVVSWLGDYTRNLGCSSVEIPFLQSARNAPAEEFWRSLPESRDPETLANLQFVPNRTAHSHEETPKPAAAEHSVDYASIATVLNSVSSIRRQMRKHRAIELETPTETRLAAIWQDLLDAEHIDGSSNFFDLGGHSLKVVLLLMRVSEVFQVSLGIEDVYASEVSLERMARRIDELIAFGGVGHEEYTRILNEIESMTEQEAASAWLEESLTNADPVSR